jgi:hypothetical protein
MLNKPQNNHIMKSIKSAIYLFTIILTISCSSDNAGNSNNFANAVSRQGCLNVTGPTAVYWDYAHGIPAPFTRIPMIQNPSGRFNHQAVFTNINISIPQGYTATQVLTPNQTYGVDLRRSNNDNQNKVLWRYYPVASFPSNYTVAQIRAIVINDLLVNEYGFNGTPIVDCAPPDQASDFGGFTRTFSSRAIRFQNTRAIIWIAVSPLVFNQSVTISVSAAPINEFDQVALDVFFPLSFELLIRDEGTTLSDRDNDGTPDIYDTEPDNPNVQ